MRSVTGTAHSIPTVAGMRGLYEAILAAGRLEPADLQVQIGRGGGDMATQAASALGWAYMVQTVRDVIGDPASWPNYREGGIRMPLLRGATIVGARETDRDVRLRLLEILRPGILVEDSLNHLL